jgi:hypothetical protein
MKNLRMLAFCSLLTVMFGATVALASTGAEQPVLSSEAGFYEIEPVAFSFQNQKTPLSFKSSRVRMSYSFHPADRHPSMKPLFVFFNGGPGCSTSEGLLSLNTSPVTLDKERTHGKFIKDNPNSWTEVGNLLYIDAPITGFSYNLLRNPADPKRRAAQFGAKNFNPFIDAAQFIRLLLRFLAVHPSLQDNPVILVGESYGGIRASAMLNLLLFYSQYGDGSKIYRDSALALEINQHLEKVFPNEPLRPFPPTTIAGQFSRQLLIEPLLAGEYQDNIAGELFEKEGSPIYRIAMETGKKYTPCPKASAADPEPCVPRQHALRFVSEADRDVYHYEKPAEWFEKLGDFAGAGLLHVNVLSRAFGWSALAIPELPPTARTEAYRYKKTPSADLKALVSSPAYHRLPVDQRMLIEREIGRLKRSEEAGGAGKGSTIPGEPVSASGMLVEVLGPLQPWDGYLVGCNMAALAAFYDNRAIDAGYDIAPTSLLYGELFLQNLALVDTFITDAALDLVIYPPSLPLALKKYSSLVEDVTTRDGFMTVTYKPGALPDIPTPRNRTIFFPRYAQSGHGVPASQPRKILNDVIDWLLSRMDMPDRS